MYTREVIVPLSVVHGLARALFAVQRAKVRTVQSGRRRVVLYDKRGCGSGPPLVLIHGLGSNASSFATLLRPAARLSRRVLVPDLPGHGRSELRPGDAPLLLDELGAAVLAVLDDLGEPAVLVGNSLGGALGLHALVERPAQVLGWMGLAPAGAPLTDDDRASLRRAFSGGLPAARELRQRLWHRPPALSWLVLRDFARYWQRADIEAIVAEVLEAQVDLALHQLRDQPGRALVLWGESDGLLPRSSVDYFRAQLGDAAVELVPRCGHLPQLERSGLVARRLAQFLTALPVYS